jgi:hypothetical protein
MKNNCGVMAFDQINDTILRKNSGVISFDKTVGKLNGKTSRLSMDTIAKMAQDNGFLLYPMKIPREVLSTVEFPYIVHLNNHFETWEEETALDPDTLPETIYILSHQFYPEYVIDEEEAKNIKGGKKAKQISAPASVTGLQKQLNTGGTVTPLGTMAAGQIQSGLAKPFGQLYPDVTADPYIHSTLQAMDENYSKDLKGLNDFYNQYGGIGSAEHEQALSDFHKKARSEKEQAVNQFNVQRQQNEISTRNNYLAQALGLDASTVAQLAQLAGLDTEIAATNLGAKVKKSSDVYGLIGSGIGAVGSMAGL